MTKKLPFYQIDAFSSQLFGGNPAAVVLLEQWLPDHQLQAIAAENNLAETAFMIPDTNEIALRWFSPLTEVDLCGHATLAAAYVLFTDYYTELNRLNFTTSGGLLTVDRQDEWLSLDFPARPGVSIDISDDLVAALGARPTEVYRSRDLLAVFDAESAITDLQPDFDRIAKLDGFGLIVTSIGASKGIDFVSRFFVPGAGIPEAPVTGSTHCTLIPYWAKRLGKQRLQAMQLSARGGALSCELHGDRVSIAGQVVEYLRGEISIVV